MEQDNNNNEEQLAVRPHRHTKPQEPHDVVFKIRQVLNILFMLLGIAGAVMYSGWVGDGKIVQMGAIVAVIAICMKMAECVLRYKK